MADKLNIFDRAVSLDTAPPFEPYTGVRLWHDDENICFAGDETGRILEADCPWATQEIAESILLSVKDYVYKPFQAGGALLDPAAELGDGVTVGCEYGPLASIFTSFSAMCASDIGAPEDEELDHEYPYLSPLQRKTDRKIAQTRSLIEKKIDSITLSVVNDETSSTLTLKAGETTLSSEDITFSGFVTFEGLSGGTTTIDGACIKTGTISADRIDASSLTVSAANITGTLTVGQLPSDVATTGYVTTITGNAISTASISADQITTGTLSADSIGLNGLLELKVGSATYGYVGATTGMDSQGNSTYGVMLCDPTITNYYIATTGGVRMQASSNRIVVTSSAAYYNGSEIATVDLLSTGGEA